MSEQNGKALEALEAIGRAVGITRHGTIPITVEKPVMELFREEFEVVRAALSADGGEAQPTGWKLVPVEPTTAMIEKAQSDWLADPLRRSRTIWYGMIDAAPVPGREHPND